MNLDCYSLKNRHPAARLATMYADQASLPKEVCHFKILSINQVHEVSGHFLSSVLDKRDAGYLFAVASSLSLSLKRTEHFPGKTFCRIPLPKTLWMITSPAR